MKRLDSILKCDGMRRDEARDDSERIVPMASASEIRSSPLNRVPEIAPLMDRIVPIRWPITRDIEEWYKKTLLLTIAIFAMGGVVFLLFSATPAIVFVAICVFAMFGWSIWQRIAPGDIEMREQYIHATTRFAICPTCLYDLASCEPDDDGLARCPECGSRWRTDRFERTEPFRIPNDSESWDLNRKITGVAFGQFFRKNTRDAAGRWVTLAEPRSKTVRERIKSDDHRARIRSATRKSCRKGRLARWFLAVIFLLLAFSMLFSLRTVVAPPFVVMAIPLTFTYLWVGIFFGLCARNLLVGRLGVDPHRIVSDALKAGLCPACWSDLRHAEAGNDPLNDSDILTCRACGARWNAPPGGITDG